MEVLVIVIRIIKIIIKEKQRNYNNNSQGDRPRRGGAEGGYNNEGGAGRGNRDPRPQTANDKPNRGVSRGGAPKGN